MKHCPNCNQTFEEQWLSFCTHDGTSLVDGPAVRSEPPPTVLSTATPQMPTPGPSPFDSLPQTPAAEVAPSVWQPPPPPSYVPMQSSGLGTASMIVGIASMVCLGPIPAIVAIVLGAMTLSQIKKSPATVGGKQQAVTGIVTGSLALLIYGGILIFYILMFVVAAASR